MTILESLTAIAKARPDLVQELTNGYGVGGGIYVSKMKSFVGFYEQRAMLLLWAFETAAREGVHLTLARAPGEEVYTAHGDGDWSVSGCPTLAALAALAAALTTTEEEAT